MAFFGVALKLYIHPLLRNICSHLFSHNLTKSAKKDLIFFKIKSVD